MRSGSSWRRDPRQGLLVIVAGIGFVSFVAVTVLVVATPLLLRMDAVATEAVRSMRGPVADAVARGLAVAGDTVGMSVLTLAAVTALLVRRRMRDALYVAATVLAGASVSTVMKWLVQRPRPEIAYLVPMPESPSFPSGHAVAATCLAGALAFIVLSESRAPFRVRAVLSLAMILPAAAMALSRIYLGVHYVSDVVAGVALGAFVVVTGAMIFLAITRAGEPA